MSLKFLTNLNSAPYYDDFAEDKKFLKILFNPKLPVQVRELIQIQSILSDQLSRLGDSSLTDGTMVIDGNFNVDTNVEYVKLKSHITIISSQDNVHTSASIDIVDISESMEYSLNITDASGDCIIDGKVSEGQSIIFVLNTVNVPDGTKIPYRIEGVSENDIDVDLTGYFTVSSNKATISAQISTDVVNDSETLNIFIENNLKNSSSKTVQKELLSKTLSNFENRVVRGNISGAEFFVRKITVDDGNDQNTIYGYHITGDKKLLENEKIETIPEKELSNYYAIVDSDSEYTGKSSFATVNSGIFYVGGMFHIVDKQELILEKYSDNPKYRIGLEVVEKIIDYSDDPSLLDNAKGTPNKNAPGADRFSVDLLLKKEKYDNPLESTIVKNSGCQFYEFLRVDGSRRINLSKKFPYTFLSKMLSEERKRQGDKVVKPFHLDIDDHPVDNSKLILNLSPGKAYVNGFDVETNSKKSIEIDKARETSIVENDYISFDHGNYFYVEIPSNATPLNLIPSFQNHETLQLFDSTGTLIGQLKLKLIDFDSYGPVLPAGTTGAIYKLYFYDLEMGSVGGAKYNVSDILYLRRLGSPNNSFQINTPRSRIVNPILPPSVGSNKTFISEPKPNSLIFDVSDKSIKQTNNFKYMTSISKTLGHASNTLIFTLEENQEFASEFTGITVSGNRNNLIDRYLTVLDKDTGFRYENLSVTTTPETSDIKEAQITIQSAPFPASTDRLVVICKCFTNTSSYRTKTKKTFTTPANTITGTTFPYNLGKTDVISIDSVTISGVDKTDDFSLDTGQTDNYYGFSKINTTKSFLGESIVVTFTYFEHGPSEGFFTPDSYLNSGANPADIENYVSNITGKSYDLTNSIDFRPSLDETTGTILKSSVPVNSIEISSISYERYLGRIDKVVIDENRNIEILKGSSEVIPKSPDDVHGKFSIYTLSIPPYTKNKNEIDIFSFDCDKDDDLQLLIEKGKNHHLHQKQNGMEIYKTGLFVDDFANHSYGDVNSSSYTCSIDYSNKELRNSFYSKSRKMEFNLPCSVLIDPCNETSSDIFQKGPYVMPRYEEVEFLVNPLISQSIELNPHKSISWHGDVKIFPTMDRWYDDSIIPEVVSNIESKNDNWEVEKSFGYQWNDWQDRWFGNEELESVPDNMLRTKENASKRRDVLNFIQKPNNTKKCDKDSNEVKEIVHYSRSNQVYFIADNLKPHTQFYGFLDEVSLTGNIFPAHILNVSESDGLIDDYSNGEILEGQDSGSTAKILRISLEDSTKIFVYDKRGTFTPGEILRGLTSLTNVVLNSEENPTTLVSNSIGELCGYFWVPSNTKVGEKIFRLNDLDSSDVSNSKSLSETSYYIQGKMEDSEKSIKSTRLPSRKRSHMNVENSLYEDVYSREYLMPFKEGDKYLEKVDYLSQSFEVNRSLFKDGLFLSSIDLFFKKKDDKLPVSIEIRPISNGYPSPNVIIPFSQVTVSSKDVKVSDIPKFELEESCNTRFTFDVPLYLVAGEYSIVIKGGGYDYELWSCENGKIILDESGDECYEQMIVTQQPNVGEIFSSHNSGVYQSIRNQHLAFRMNRCEFPVGKFKACFDSVSSTSDRFNLFNFQVKTLESFDDVTDLEFEYSSDLISFEKFEKNRNVELLDPIKINTIDSVVGDLFRVTAKWESSNTVVSPIFDLESMNLVTVKNSSSGGTYISKIVHLDEHQKSKDIRVFLDAYKPYGNLINVYYKIGNSNDVLDFETKTWNPLELIQPKNRHSKNIEDYFEMEFGNLNGINLSQEQFDTFDMFSVRVDLQNDGVNFTDDQYFPKVKDLRAVALKEPVGLTAQYELVAEPSDEIFEDPLLGTNAVKFTLYTSNLPAGTIVPYVLTGIQPNDVVGLTTLEGNFVLDASGKDSVTFTLVNDPPDSPEYIELMLKNVVPVIFKKVFIVDAISKSYDINFINCGTLTGIDNTQPYCNNQDLCINLSTTGHDPNDPIPFTVTGLPEYEIKITEEGGTEIGDNGDTCNFQDLSIKLSSLNLSPGTQINFTVEGTGIPAG